MHVQQLQSVGNDKQPILLDHPEIDADHQAFVELIGKLAKADDVGFATLFDELVEHTEAHFARENGLMDASGFPATAEHQGEHRRVVGELKQFAERVHRGLVPFARAFVAESLVPWFGLHIATMDSALVAHLRATGAR